MIKHWKKGIIGFIASSAIIGGTYLGADTEKTITIQNAQISLSAKIAGVETNIDNKLTPYKTERASDTKFGFRFDIPTGITGKNIAQNLDSITFKITSFTPLVQMGSNAVGYWLPPKDGVGAIEAFKYDFSDILQQFTTSEIGQVREYIDGKWTGKFIEGIVQKPVPHSIEIKDGNAFITFDLKGIKFSEGQIIDFDPIAQTGSNTEFNITTANSGTVSTTITVPDDATMIIVGISGYKAEANYFSSGAMTMTKGGADTAMVAVQPSTRGDGSILAFYSAMFYQVLPDTGTNKTLKWDWLNAGTAVNAPIISITFWKGIDTANPVRGSGGGQNSDTPYTASSITAQSGDLIVAWVGGYAGGSEGTINTWSNLSTLAQVTFYGAADGAWATGSPTGNTIVAASTATYFSDGGIVGISLIPAASGTVINNFCNQGTCIQINDQ